MTANAADAVNVADGAAKATHTTDDAARTATPMRIVIVGLSITSSWGNGHATTYRGLVRELVRRGHDVLFLECDVPWYARHRDLPHPPHGRTALYDGLDQLQRRHARDVAEADLVIVGSYVRDGVAVGDWVQQAAGGLVAFYDIDTPITLARLARTHAAASAVASEPPYIEARQIPGYDLYLSFTGGPTLERLEREFGSPAARVLYCSVDPALYFPPTETDTEAADTEAARADTLDPAPHADLRWDLAYMGTYSDDRQPTLDRLLLQPAARWDAGRFAVAGPQYPLVSAWPGNVRHIEHLPPAEHRGFYNRQRFTLNVTRADMIRAGWSPSVRLFEAAACGTPIISDRWDGIDTLLVPGREIFLADTPDEVLHLLRELPDDERRAVGRRARERILGAHTAAHRAAELEAHVVALMAEAGP